MDIKRPFSNTDWDTIPTFAQEYIITLEQTCAQASTKIEQLEKSNNDLEKQTKKNSHNSNQPSSTDSPYNKPKKERKQSKKKQGAQKGHEGHQQELLNPTETIPVSPVVCECGCCQIDPESLEPFYIHQEIELPQIEMEVLHFILNKGECLNCGKTVKATIPQEHQTGYGPRLSALIAELSGTEGNSRSTVANFCHSVLNIPISTGAIQKIIDRASEAIKPHYEAIGDVVRAKYVNYIDETSWFLGHALAWLWVMTNTAAAFFMIHQNRSKVAFLELIQDWKGILVSDNYGVYVKWVNLRQSCLAHLIRRGKGLAESSIKSTADFGKKIVTELQLLCHWAKAPPDDKEWADFYERFIDLIFNNVTEDNECGALARSLLRQIDCLWTFLEVFGVEPTNNRAERGLRASVIWRKRSKGTQSEKGNRWVERILTLKETCRIQNIPTYPLLVNAIQAYFRKANPDLEWIDKIAK